MIESLPRVACTATPEACSRSNLSRGVVETDADGLPAHLDGLLEGRLCGVLARGIATPAECARIFENFIRSPGQYRRSDGVPGRMVGTNAYLRDTPSLLSDYLRNNGHAELLFEGTRNVFRMLYDAIEEAGNRFRPSYVDGVPAPTHRATVWEDSSGGALVLKAHTDWPQVRFSGREYADVAHPIAVNFYPRHPSGGSCVRLYDFVPTPHWLEERGILAGGYPIHADDLHDVEHVDIEPRSGDLLLFAAANVHAVFQAATPAEDARLNINGFVGHSPRAGRVLAWA